MNVLVFLYRYFGNLGFAIILASIFVRLITTPLYLPNLKTAKKQKEIKPELDALREKFKYDKKKLAEKQMELFRKHGINPASGCFSSIFAILIPIALYIVIRDISSANNISAINSRLYFDSLKFSQGEFINSAFLFLDISKPDKTLILPILCAFLQFLSSKMMLPSISKAEKLANKTPSKSDDIMYSVQEQTLYLFPIMMLFFGFSLPSGVMLNILISTIFTIIQTYFVMGWGGLTPYVQRLNKLKIKRHDKI